MSNDPRLGPMVDSGGAEAEIERVLETAAPLIRKIVSRYFRTGGDPSQDADDLVASINLRLLHKLRRMPSGSGEEIQDLDKYVAMLSYNVVNDQLRRRFPERTRLKNRVRYVLTHDPRLALWNAPAGMAAGLKQWSGATAAVTAVPLDRDQATRRMRDRDRPADALHALLTVIETPVELEALVDYIAALWDVIDLPPPDPERLAEQHAGQQVAPEQLERRELLRALWLEIEQLRPMQRKALLLNLRDEESVNVVALLVLTGVARFDDVAKALEISPEELSEIWNELPLDDLRIGELLNVTRQQVINLRKSARERLSRRVRNNRRDRTS
jgi:RNA polymerase sigma factor (sigma-70 family)